MSKENDAMGASTVGDIGRCRKRSTKLYGRVSMYVGVVYNAPKASENEVVSLPTDVTVLEMLLLRPF